MSKLHKDTDNDEESIIIDHEDALVKNLNRTKNEFPCLSGFLPRITLPEGPRVKRVEWLHRQRTTKPRS
jgi:hypothetical protein